MEKLYKTVILILLTCSAFSQTRLSQNPEERLESLPQNLNNEEKVIINIDHNTFKFNTTIAKGISLQRRNDTTSTEGIKKGHKVYVFKVDSLVYYRYFNFKKDSVLRENFSKDDVFFTMPLIDFREVTEEIYSRFKGFRFGAYSIPYRLRGNAGLFDFENSLSLQANLIAGVGKQTVKNSQIDFSLGLGLSSAYLNSRNSNVTENRTASTFTFSTGAVYKPTKEISLGLFVGFDFLNRSDRLSDWDYNKKPWIGLGLNVGLNEMITDNNAKK